MISVSLSTLTFVAAVVPNSTVVVPVNCVPVIVTNVPPAAVPELGLKLVTVGTDG